jgi:hypothetical protein
VNRRRFILTVAAVFVLACIVDFLIHHIALAGLYHETANVWRPVEDMQPLAMYVSQLFFALMFVFIFLQNNANKGFTEGLRYGSYIGLLLAAIDLATYTYLPIPFILTVSWMAAVFIKSLLCGLVTAVVYNH